MNWRTQALCRGMDINLFFPKVGQQISEQVRQTCQACPVREQCLAESLRADYIVGVWAGMDKSDRLAMKPRRFRINEENVQHGTNQGIYFHKRTKTKNCQACAAKNYENVLKSQGRSNEVA